MKKLIYTILALVISVGLLTACGVTQAQNDKMSIVCTTFPQYDWVKEIVGENAEVFEITYLLEDGIDIHSYQPTAMDIAKIANCDLLIYLGGESEEWVEEVISQNANPNMQVLHMMDCIGDAVKTEEMVEGMQHDHTEEEHHHDEIVYDEHIWLSLRNAKVLVEKITSAVIKLDVENTATYQANAMAYIVELENLDAAYSKVVTEAEMGTVLFADRFPFRYLLDDYAINYYAAFVGCSAETEASFETVAFLAEKLDELSLQHVLILEKSDTRLADSIIKNAKSGNQDILVLDSIQAVSGAQIAEGITYLGIMQENLEILKKALN